MRGAVSPTVAFDAEVPPWLLAGILAVWIGALVVLAGVPPVDRDALTHHLAVPKLYLQHGMVEIPWVPFSYYPMNLDLLYLIPLYFGNDILPKYIHLTFALMTAGLICGYVRRRVGGLSWGLTGALLFLSLPVVVKLSITVYVDLGLMFFSTAALLAMLRWVETGFRVRHLVLSGACCGLALGTKYNALISLLLLASLVPFVFLRSRRERSPAPPQPAGGRFKVAGPEALRAVGSATVFVLVALAVYSPWMIRNALWTGNPVYPLYGSIFMPKEKTLPSGLSASGVAEPAAEEGMNHFVLRRLIFKESILETLTIPIRIFFQGEDDNPKLFDGRLNPYLLLLPLAALLLRKGPRWPVSRVDTCALAAFPALFILFAFVQSDMRIRYVGPAVPPLVILATIGMRQVLGAMSGRMRTAAPLRIWFLAGLVLTGVMAPNAIYLIGQFRSVDPWSYIGGSLTRDEYIQKFRPEYEVVRYSNANLPADARILGLFMGNRIYYSDHAMLRGDEAFYDALQRSRSDSEFDQRVRAAAPPYVMARLDMLDSVADELGPETRRRLDRFRESAMEPLFVRHGYGVFRLRGHAS